MTDAAEERPNGVQAYTVEQVAEMLHVGRDKVYYLSAPASFAASRSASCAGSPTGTSPISSPRSKAPDNRIGGERVKFSIGRYEATIYREGDGYTGALSLGFDAAGRRRRSKRKGRTKAQVKDKLREVVEDLESGVTGTDGYTVEQAVDDFASGMRIDDISALVGHSGTSVTEAVYRHEIRPALTKGTTAMDKILCPRRKAPTNRGATAKPSAAAASPRPVAPPGASLAPAEPAPDATTPTQATPARHRTTPKQHASPQARLSPPPARWSQSGSPVGSRRSERAPG